MGGSVFETFLRLLVALHLLLAPPRSMAPAMLLSCDSLPTTMATSWKKRTELRLHLSVRCPKTRGKISTQKRTRSRD